MSLLSKIDDLIRDTARSDLYETYGIAANPFPSASQTTENPHFRLEDVDEQAERKIAAFFHDNRSQAIVIEGTQGVGKTNFLNFYAAEIAKAASKLSGFYVVRYLADPENVFDGTLRRLLEELGTGHILKLVERIKADDACLDRVRNPEVRKALSRLEQCHDNADESAGYMMEWLQGLRLLKVHRESLGVQFRLDTIESKTSALRDLVEASEYAGILNGIFLLLDEMEKQDGVLGPRPVVRYLSAIRALIDALPRSVFLMIAVTPDALRRYSIALPALRGRLENRIRLPLLEDLGQAQRLAHFYVDEARKAARAANGFIPAGENDLVSDEQVEKAYEDLLRQGGRRADDGVRQREFLHKLHQLAERAIYE